MKVLAARVTATESAHPDSVVIVLGDFNHTNLKKFLPRYKQHVDCATCNDKTLDQCYTVHTNAYNALVRAPLGESDHSTVLLIPTYRQKLRTIKPTKKVVRKMTDDSYDVLRGCFDCTDWNMFKESCGDIDELTGMHSDIVYQLVRGYVFRDEACDNIWQRQAVVHN